MSINATNIYSQNSTSIKNTTVQPSQFNGGNLSQMFDLQTMRTVKGRVTLNTNNPPQFYTVINEYDGSPVTLGSNDFIIGYGVMNGSGTTDVLKAPLPLTPQSTTSSVGVGNSPLLQFFINPLPPGYNQQTGVWSPTNPTGLTVIPVTDQLTNGTVNGAGLCINPGYGSLSTVLSTSCGLQSYLQMNQTNNPFTIVDPAISAGAINITLIILSVNF